MELTSGILEVEQIWAEISELVSLLGEKHVAQVLVSYGFGCDCDPDELYRDIAVDVTALKSFLSILTREGVCQLGEADVYLKIPELGLEVLLCHESDIHFETEDADIIARVKSSWLAKGYSAYGKAGAEWTPISART